MNALTLGQEKNKVLWNGRPPLSPTALTNGYRLGSVLYAVDTTYFTLAIFYLFYFVLVVFPCCCTCHRQAWQFGGTVFRRHKKSGVALDFVLH